MLIVCPVRGLDQVDEKGGASSSKAEAEEIFRDRVTPFIKNYCLECHSNKRPTEAGVNFSPALKAPGHAAFNQQWKKAMASAKAHDMPPDYANRQPTEEERAMFVDWVSKIKYLSEEDPGLFIIRRLTKTEYGNTLHDLFGVSPTIVKELPDEVSGEGYLNSLSPLQLEHYLRIAEQVLDQVFPSEQVPATQLQRQLFGEPYAVATNGRETARGIARDLARRAYRRPTTEEEVDVLVQVFDKGLASNLTYPLALRFMVKAILVSPQFLFITPHAVFPNDADIVALDGYLLASRLSYFLWATMPDDELMSLADEGRLHEPSVLRTQTLRLLADPRSRALFDGFGAQWLGIQNLKEKEFDPTLFPEMTRELRGAMYDEARLLFESVVRENRSVAGFVDCDYTYLNAKLAKIYGIDKPGLGPAMQRVSLTDRNRGGILSMPGILAATSFPNRTSPVKRGVWVLEQVLGDHVPPAPPDVPALEQQDPKSVSHLTLRERTELHRTNPVCANCHRTLDPIGFGLENFDAIGRWRDYDDNGQVIDATGELPEGENFAGPKALKAYLAGRMDKLSRNLIERLLAYALCRKLEGYDEIVVDELMEEVRDEDYRMQTLITSIVTSYPFTHRKIREE